MVHTETLYIRFSFSSLKPNIAYIAAVCYFNFLSNVYWKFGGHCMDISHDHSEPSLPVYFLYPCPAPLSPNFLHPKAWMQNGET